MKVLVACEFSGLVRDAFKAKGHDAVSCDILPSERPGHHIQGNVLNLLSSHWDMMIAFPPCTYLAYSGGRYWHAPGREKLRLEAAEFFNRLLNAPIPKIALENPRGAAFHLARWPDQRIEPSDFGHFERKGTYLWLKNLPPLMPLTWLAVEPRWTRKDGRGLYFTEANRGSLARSRTFPGVASAMADQWG